MAVCFRSLKPILLPLVLLLQLLPATAQGEILVVVNADNPLDELTLKNVKQLFLGRLRRFPVIDSDVDVLDREENSVLHRKFYQEVVRMDPIRLKRYRARYLFSGQGRLPETVMGQDAVIELVQQKVSAVGYIELQPDEPLPERLKIVYRQ